MSLPVVPGTFTAGEHTISDLQALANCARFLSVCDTRPTWHLYRTATQAIAGTTNQAIAMNVVAVDSDGVSDGTGATIVTQGIYTVEACIPFQTGASQISALGHFQFTGGASNPYHSGVSFQFGGRGTLSTNIASTDTALSLRAECPWTCFPGDKIQVIAWSSLAVSINNNNNLNAFSGRFPPTFTGEWIRTGS